jgi:hypothetical protein
MNSVLFRNIIHVCLVDSDFRNGLFKLTAMLIHNLNNPGKD